MAPKYLHTMVRVKDLECVFHAMMGINSTG